jgi:hypothetical protein
MGELARMAEEYTLLVQVLAESERELQASVGASVLLLSLS